MVHVAHDYGKAIQKPGSFNISSTELTSGSRGTAEVLFLANGPGQNTSQKGIENDVLERGER
jgi:hypothetical protein